MAFPSDISHIHFIKHQDMMLHNLPNKRKKVGKAKSRKRRSIFDTIKFPFSSDSKIHKTSSLTHKTRDSFPYFIFMLPSFIHHQHKYILIRTGIGIGAIILVARYIFSVGDVVFFELKGSYFSVIDFSAKMFLSNENMKRNSRKTGFNFFFFLSISYSNILILYFLSFSRNIKIYATFLCLFAKWLF
jgi:hypothetical protein